MNITPTEDNIFLSDVDEKEPESTAKESPAIPQSINQVSASEVKPDQKVKKLRTGTVAAVGPGRKGEGGKTIPVGFSVGDKVAINNYSDDWVEINGRKLLSIRPYSIVAKIEKDLGEGLRKMQKAAAFKAKGIKI